MFRLYIICIGFLFSLTSVYGQDREDQEFKIGVWDGRSQFDANNQFTACSVYGHMDIGKAVHLVLKPDETFIIAAEHSALSFHEMEEVSPITILINDKKAHIGVGTAASKHLLVMVLPFKKELLDLMLTGKSITFKINKQKQIRYTLKSFDMALAALGSCVDKYNMDKEESKPEGRTTIDESSKKIEKNLSSQGNVSLSDLRKKLSDDKKVDVFQFLSNLFLKNKFQNTSLFSQKDMSNPDGMEIVQKAVAAWGTKDHVLGVLYVYEGGAKDIHNLSTQVLMDDARECTGDFMNSKRESSTEEVQAMTALCHGGVGFEGRVEYIFAARENNEIYQFILLQLPTGNIKYDKKALEKETGLLFSALLNEGK